MVLYRILGVTLIIRGSTLSCPMVAVVVLWVAVVLVKIGGLRAVREL
jgi:hypothetical protein